MLSIYNPAAPVANRIYYLKHYETYDGVAINQNMFQILTEYNEKALLQIIDAILYTRNIDSGRIPPYPCL